MLIQFICISISLLVPNKLLYTWCGYYYKCIRPVQLSVLNEVRAPSLLEQHPWYVPHWDRPGYNMCLSNLVGDSDILLWEISNQRKYGYVDLLYYNMPSLLLVSAIYCGYLQEGVLWRVYYVGGQWLRLTTFPLSYPKCLELLDKLTCSRPVHVCRGIGFSTRVIFTFLYISKYPEDDFLIWCFFSTVHHSIELFHQPTLMHNFLYSSTIG